LKNPPPKSILGYDPLLKANGKNEKINKYLKTEI
jgi:hypothetical protein